MFFDLFKWNGNWECVEYWVAHFTCVFSKRKVALHRFFSFLGICGHLSPVEDGQVPEFRGLSNHILPSGQYISCATVVMPKPTILIIHIHKRFFCCYMTHGLSACHN